MIQVLGLPFLMCLVLLAILSSLGIHVLKREVIFIDIALAQFAAVGAIIAQMAFHAHAGSVVSFLVSLALVLVVGGFYALARRRILQVPVEAVIGVSYAVAAAGGLFLAGVAPGGHIHVQQMLAGSILWVTWNDLLVCLGAFVVVGLLFGIFRGPLGAISEDYERAISNGVNVVLWDFVFYALCGLVITLAVRVSGIVVVFAFLIIPATISALFSSGWRTRLLVAWAAGAAASVLGLLFAYRLDFSMGPSVAALCGLELVLAGVYSFRRLRGIAVAGAGGLILLLVGLLLGTLGTGRVGARHTEDTASPIHIGHEHDHDTGNMSEENFSELVSEATEGRALLSLYLKAPDDRARTEVAVRALDTDVRAGVQLTLRFLSEDPPLFFRQTAVDKLEEATGEPSGLSVEEPFHTPANQAAAERLAREHGLGTP